MGASATGAFIWGSEKVDGCGPGLPSFRQEVNIRVARREPIRLPILERDDVKPAYTVCFSQEDGYLTILILAWTCILSARWTEIISGSSSLVYIKNQTGYDHDNTTCQERQAQSTINIHIANTSP